MILEVLFVQVYIYAAYSLHATTGGFTFDTVVMMIGAVLNSLVLWNQYVYCIDTLVVVYQEIVVLILLCFCIGLIA